MATVSGDIAGIQDHFLKKPVKRKIAKEEFAMRDYAQAIKERNEDIHKEYQTAYGNPALIDKDRENTAKEWKTVEDYFKKNEKTK